MQKDRDAIWHPGPFLYQEEEQSHQGLEFLPGHRDLVLVIDLAAGVAVQIGPHILRALEAVVTTPEELMGGHGADGQGLAEDAGEAAAAGHLLNIGLDGLLDPALELIGILKGGSLLKGSAQVCQEGIAVGLDLCVHELNEASPIQIDNVIDVAHME